MFLGISRLFLGHFAAARGVSLAAVVSEREEGVDEGSYMSKEKAYHLHSFRNCLQREREREGD